MVVPVLRLPHIAFENVYLHLEIPDAIMLSQCSKRMKTIVKSIEKCRALTWGVYVGKTDASVAVCNAEKNVIFEWKVSSETLRADNTRECVIKGDQSCITVRLIRSNEWLSVPRDDENPENDLFCLVQIFKDIFHSPIGVIMIKSFDFISCDKLLRRTSILHTAPRIEIYLRKGVSPSDVNFMLDTLNADKLKFLANAGEYSYQKPVLRFQNVQIYLAQWISAAYFMEMANTCKKVKFYKATRISDGDLNKFLKAWLAGNNEILEKVKISRKNTLPEFASLLVPFRKKVILDGVEHTKMVENGSDIKVMIERSDGKLAWVIIQQETHHRFPHFMFIVVN